MPTALGEIEILEGHLPIIGILEPGTVFYKEAGATDMPKIYLLIDNFNAFKELYMDAHEAQFIKLCRDGISLGISIVITNASASGIGYRHMSNFANHICYTCSDSGEYSSMFDRCRMEPKNIPGRALMERNKTLYEVQTYLAFEGEREIERADAVKKYIYETNQKYASSLGAKQIPCIPERLSRDEFTKEYSRYIEKNAIPFGLDFSTIDPTVINMEDEFELSLVGKYVRIP